MKKLRSTVAVILAATVLSFPSIAQGQTLGAGAASFAILGGQSVTAANGATQTLINGDVGVSPGNSITGFPAFATTVPPYAVHNNDGFAVAAQSATTSLYNTLAAAPAGTPIGNELGGQVYGPGTYSIGAANLAASTNLTLSGAGTYVFKVASSLVANVSSTVTLVGVDPCRVFWQVTSAATLNGVNFAGNVIAQSAVTVGSNAIVAGRVLTTSLGDVTLAGGNSVGGCSAAAAEPPAPPAGADLIIVKSHTGNFVAGTQANFTIAIENLGGTATAGVYTISDTLPDGLTFVSAVGSGWTCDNVGQLVTCTSSVVIAADGTGNTLTLRVMPDEDAVPTVVNSATVSGGGDTVPGNNTTIDVVIVTPEVPPVPTVPQIVMMLMAAMMGAIAYVSITRRRLAPARMR